MVVRRAESSTETNGAELWQEVKLSQKIPDQNTPAIRKKSLQPNAVYTLSLLLMILSCGNYASTLQMVGHDKMIHHGW